MGFTRYNVIILAIYSFSNFSAALLSMTTACLNTSLQSVDYN